MTVSTELTVEQRELIFEDMDDLTKEAALEGAQKVQAGCKIALLIAYDIGSIVNRIFDAEHLSSEEKKAEVGKLSAYWNQRNMNPSTLYDMCNVASAFDRKFINAQVDEPLASGKALTWSHFKELQKIGPTPKKTAEERQLAYLKQIRKHSWSANEFAQELRGKDEAAITRTGGRKPSLPKTPNGMLQKLFASIQQSDNYVQAVGEPLEGIFMEMSADAMDEKFLENLDNTLGRLNDAVTRYKDVGSRLKKVRARALKMQRKSGTEASAKEESPAEDKVEATASEPVAEKPKASSSKRGTPRRSKPAEVAEAT